MTQSIQLNMLGDDDRQDDGSNPGVKAAEAAAKLVDGIVVTPGLERKADFWDLWHEQGDEFVRARLEKAIVDHRLRQEKTYKFLSFGDVAELPPMRWRVKGVLPESGMAAIYGPAASGKSFLALDLAAALAEGNEWFGLRVTRSPVVYLCLEGQAGLRNRVAAYRSHHGGRTPNDVHVITESFDILTSDTAVLTRSIQGAGLKKPVIMIDTLNRAAPGADENSSVDMGKIIAAAKYIQQATDGLVIVIHHSGKDLSKDLRGHSSLRGALDAIIAVKRDGDVRRWTTAQSSGGKVKDNADGVGYAFTLKVHHLGEDEDGDPITSCAVVPICNGVDPKIAPRKTLGTNASIAVGILGALYEQNRSNLAKSGKNPQEAQVRTKEWCDALRETGGLHKNRSYDARAEAINKGYVHYCDGYVYLLPESPQDINGDTEIGRMEKLDHVPDFSGSLGTNLSKKVPSGTGTAADECRRTGTAPL